MKHLITLSTPAGARVSIFEDSSTNLTIEIDESNNAPLVVLKNRGLPGIIGPDLEYELESFIQKDIEEAKTMARSRQ